MQLLQQAFHPGHRVGDGGEHVLPEPRVVAVAFGVLQHQGELAGQVLDVVGDEGEAPVELVQLPRVDQGVGRVLLGQVARRLPAHRLQQVVVLPVQAARRPRRGEQQEGAQHLAVHQRHDQPGPRYGGDPIGRGQAAVSVRPVGDLGQIDDPFALGEERHHRVAVADRGQPVAQVPDRDREIGAVFLAQDP